MGTGGGKLLLWKKLETVEFQEVGDVKIKGGKWDKAVEEGAGDIHDRTKMNPMFADLTAGIAKSIDQVAADPSNRRLLITRVFLGCTQWYRALKPAIVPQANAFLDALTTNMTAHLQSAGFDVDAEWEEVSALNEAGFESMAVDYALHMQDIDAPVAVISGGMGSVQCTVLDGSVSFDIPARYGEDLIKEGAAFDDMSPEAKARREENKAKYQAFVREKMSTSKIPRHVNTLATASQDEDGDPVRVVCISSFFYLAKAAQLVSKAPRLPGDPWGARGESAQYAYQPAEVVLESLIRVRDHPHSLDPPAKLNDVANAVRLIEILGTVVDDLYISRVEVLFARDFQLGANGSDFRTTWTAGWWLNELMKLYRPRGPE